MADLHGLRYVCDTIRATLHQVDRNAGLHTELSACWYFDVEAAPFYAGWLRSKAEKSTQRETERAKFCGTAVSRKIIDHQLFIIEDYYTVGRIKNGSEDHVAI
jgi:hypothetical protein